MVTALLLLIREVRHEQEQKFGNSGIYIYIRFIKKKLIHINLGPSLYLLFNRSYILLPARHSYLAL
jgi:hypothetical protein